MMSSLFINIGVWVRTVFLQGQTLFLAKTFLRSL